MDGEETMAAKHCALPTLNPDPMALTMEEVRPSSERRRRWMPPGKLGASRPYYGSTATVVKHLQASDPLYYNSLVDKDIWRYFKKPTVHRHLLKRGIVTKDGTACPTRQERIVTNRTYRFQEDQEALLLRVEAREQARLQRLRRAARVGDITFTREGVFETKPCSTCGVKHKVASISSPIEPCPGSRLAKYNLPKFLAPLPEPYRSRKSRKVSLNRETTM